MKKGKSNKNGSYIHVRANRHVDKPFFEAYNLINNVSVDYTLLVMHCELAEMDTKENTKEKLV